jgi:hypothetical protein
VNFLKCGHDSTVILDWERDRKLFGDCLCELARNWSRSETDKQPLKGISCQRFHGWGQTSESCETTPTKASRIIS